MRPRAFRRRRRGYLAACKLSILLTTALVAATQTSRLPNTAKHYWHIIVFALLYGRGIFVGMTTLFLQVRVPLLVASLQCLAVTSMPWARTSLTSTFCLCALIDY